LLGGNLDHRYAESCRHTVEQEAQIGLDARIRSSAGNTVLRGALDALARAHRFSAGKLAERAKVVSQVISFDVANAMTLHRQAAERAAHTRRDAIDAAIAEFDGAIGEVIEAIKEASASLTLTGATLRQIAEDTLNRMASASSASAETARRMDATVTYRRSPARRATTSSTWHIVGRTSWQRWAQFGVNLSRQIARFPPKM
jgi:hypothetical protein